MTDVRDDRGAPTILGVEALGDLGEPWATADRTPARPAAQVPLAGRRVRLAVPADEHLPDLWRLAIDPDSGFRWRYHGAMVGPQEFADRLWDGVDAQFVAVAHDGDEPVVWCLLYGVNPRDGHGRLAVHGFPRFLATRSLWEGVFLFVRYAFANWPLRKVYAEVREFNLTQFASGAGDLFEVEGRLRRHAFHDGEWWDQFILATTRERFAEVADRWGPAFDAPPGPAPGSG